jgi:hypothetical protein
MLLSLRNFGFPTWLATIYDILYKCELAHVFDSTSFSPSEITILAGKIKTKLQDQFTDKWHTEIFTLPN